MTGTVTSALLLIALILAAIVCIFGPITVMGVMFWKWRKELGDIARTRQGRATNVR